MTRPKLPEEKKKKSVRVSISQKVWQAAVASGNVSEWLDEAGRDRLKRDERRQAPVKKAG